MDESLANDEPMDGTISNSEPIPESLGTKNEQCRKSMIKPKKHGKTRRGFGSKKLKNKSVRNNKIEFSLLGSNINGMNSKKESLFHAINEFKPRVLTLQETKVKKAGSIKIPGYQIFEKLRNGKGGGGLLTAVAEDLEPVLVSTGSEDTDIITVEAKVEKHRIRIINGYGPQEDDEKNQILNFWQDIEK